MSAAEQGELSDTVSPEFGGITAVMLTSFIAPYDLGVLQELQRHFGRLHIILSTAMNPDRQYAQDWSGLDVTIQKCVTFEQAWRHGRGGFNDRVFVHVPRDTGKLLKAIGPDIIFSRELGFRSLACARYRRRNPQARLVLNTFMSRDTEIDRGALRAALRRWLLPRADAVTYNGPDCRRLLSSWGVPEEKLYHFPYAAHRAHRTAPPAAAAAITGRHMLYVGQLTERKGVRQMLAAVNRHALAHPGHSFHLTLVGEGPLRDELANSAAADNLQLIFTGNIPVEDLPARLRRHAVLVFPTLADEWGLVVNEAMHAGLPVIGSRYAQSCQSLIRQGENGWLFDPLCAQQWQDVLAGYFQAGDEKLLAMGTAAEATARPLTPAWAARGLLDACRGLLAEAGGQS